MEKGWTVRTRAEVERAAKEYRDLHKEAVAQAKLEGVENQSQEKLSTIQDADMVAQVLEWVLGASNFFESTLGEMYQIDEQIETEKILITKQSTC